MSLFGAMMGDVEDDPFFGSHMRHMRQMNNMMNSLFADPFGMMGAPLALMPRHGSMGMMPFMPQMPQMNRLFSGDLEGHVGAPPGSSFSSSTVVMSMMSNGPNGKPQVYSSSSSTKIGPDGIKETRKTLQDSRTGTKKMSIGHHIGERAHVVEREQNVYSGDAEERQEFINLDEDEAEDFDREFQVKAGAYRGGRHHMSARLAIEAPHESRRAIESATAHESRRAIESATAHETRRAIESATAHESRRAIEPASAHESRRAIESAPAHNFPNASVREVYGGSHPSRHRHKHHKHRHSPADN